MEDRARLSNIASLSNLRPASKQQAHRGTEYESEVSKGGSQVKINEYSNSIYEENGFFAKKWYDIQEFDINIRSSLGEPKVRVR